MKWFIFTHLLLIVSLIESRSWSASPEISFVLSGIRVKGPVADLEFKTPAAHHFNQQAPNTVERKTADGWEKAHQIEIAGDSLKAQWTKTFDPLVDGIRAQLYVCDDQNTYCLPLTEKFHCDGKKIRWRKPRPLRR